MAKPTTVKQTHPVVAEIRNERGTKKTRILRATGKLPGVIYGLQKDVVSVTLPAVEVVGILHAGAHVLDVSLGGKVEKMLIQDVQYDYLQTTVEHIDLLRIDPHQKVKVKVALEFRGTPKGAKEGGILETQSTEIEVEVLATDIPDTIRVNVESLELHQILHAKDIVMPEGAKLAEYPEKIICQVRTVKEEVAAVVAEAGPAEPEVIGKKKEEEGAEGHAREGHQGAEDREEPQREGGHAC